MSRQRPRTAARSRPQTRRYFLTALGWGLLMADDQRRAALEADRLARHTSAEIARLRHANAALHAASFNPWPPRTGRR